MSTDHVWERVDVEAIVGGVFEIKLLVTEVVRLLGEDDDEEEDEGTAGA